MPKQVNHDERRRTIAEALVRVAAHQGLESVSVRHVAAEAGVSAGRVQHYFRTKDEMMAFAMEVVSEGIEARLAGAVDRLGEAPSPVALCRALLVELLPFDEPRRVEGQVALAFLAHQAVRPDVGGRAGEGPRMLRGHLADLVRAEWGVAGPDGAADAVAVALLALVDGLGLQVLGGHHAPDVALAVLDACAPSLVAPPAS